MAVHGSIRGIVCEASKHLAAYTKALRVGTCTLCAAMVGDACR